MIIVNFKTYKQATGDNAVKLAISCETVSEQTKVTIIPVVQTIDIWRVKQHVSIPVWAQHVDFQPQGQHTGYTTIEALISAEASGLILNHSEHTLSLDTLKKTIKRIREIDETFQILLCAPDIGILGKIKSLSPDFLSYEPPELIGSSTDSVVSKKAYIVSEAVKIAKETPLIVGAGIKSKEDVVAALRCNAKGVLVASAVVLSDKPEEKLHELASAFKSD